MSKYPPEVEAELVMYLKLILLEFGHEPVTHEDMLTFDKRFLGITTLDILPEKSIPAKAWRDELVVYLDNTSRPWVISELGYKLIEKHDRKQTRLK